MIFLLYFVYLGFKSQSGQASGLVNGKLSYCPDSPNCICSEFTKDKSHYIAPLSIDLNSLNNMTEVMKQVITETGGNIVQQQDDYLSATYSSNLFRYVDDIELRLDRDAGLLHIRSASRVGHSDMGANLKRATLILEKCQEKLL